MYLNHPSYTTCEISFPLHILLPHCIQPTQVKCSCLLSFFNYQPEDGKWKGPKHVVDLYVINYTYLYHHIVVLDKYTHSNLVYYKHKRGWWILWLNQGNPFATTIFVHLCKFTLLNSLAWSTTVFLNSQDQWWVLPVDGKMKSNGPL